MAGISGIGDIVLLVKLGYAVCTVFHGAVVNAPPDVLELIQQINYLNVVLRSTKTSLETHGAILRHHDDVKTAITMVLRNCEHTLLELKAVGEEYGRVVQKGGGWEDAFKNAYKRIKWQGMGATMDHIRGMLGQHFAALHLLMQDLSMHKLSELKNLMGPVSVDITELHELFHEHTLRMDSKIDQLLTIAGGSPSLPPTHHRSSLGNISLPDSAYDSEGEFTVSSPAPRRDRSASHASSIASTPRFTAPLPSPPQHVSPLAPPQNPALDLPPPAVSFEFEDRNLDLCLLFTPSRRGTSHHPFLQHATPSEHALFLSSVLGSSPHDILPLTSLTFVHRGTSYSACGASSVYIPRTSTAASSVWILDAARNLRVQHKVPVWDRVIPYALHGRPSSVVLTQGSGLLFFTPDPALRAGTSVPTSWVDYRFATAQDAHVFQERLYGCALLRPRLECRSVFRNQTVRSGEVLCGQEVVRLWRDGGGGTRVMVRLSPQRGWRRWLEFGLSDPMVVAALKGADAVRIRGCGARVHDGEAVSSGSSVSSGRSSVYSSKTAGRKGKGKVVDDVTIVFERKEDCREFYRAYLNTRP